MAFREFLLEIATVPDGRLLVLGLSAGLIGTTATLVFTYITSYLHSFPPKQHEGHEPPMAPYWVPYLGHIREFLQDPGHLVRSLSQKYPKTLFSILLPGAKFHIVTNPATAFYVFTKPRDFIAEPVVASMMSNALELDGADLQKFDVPISHLRKSPEFTPGQIESFAFVGRNHGLYLRYLHGRALDPVMEIYRRNLTGLVDKAVSTDTPIKLHGMLRKLIFDASCKTFFGDRILRIAPDLWDHWRDFDDAAYIGVRSRASFYLRPWTLPGRRRLLEAFDKWVDTELGRWEDGGIWSPDWGYKLNWERERMSRDHDMTVRGRSAVHVSLIWVVITNTAPMLTYTMNTLLGMPDILTSFRTAIASLTTSIHDIDPSKLISHPFVQAFWKELLRTGVTSAPARVVSRDVEVEGYVLRKGSVILAPTRVLHYDPDVFPQPDTFLPSRWLAGPDESQEDAERRLKRQIDSLRPFGGGTGVCSGRFVAEQEILMAAAVLISEYTWDVQGTYPVPNLNPKGLAGMQPLVDPSVIARRCRKSI